MGKLEEEYRGTWQEDRTTDGYINYQTEGKPKGGSERSNATVRIRRKRQPRTRRLDNLGKGKKTTTVYQHMKEQPMDSITI